MAGRLSRHVLLEDFPNTLKFVFAPPALFTGENYRGKCDSPQEPTKSLVGSLPLWIVLKWATVQTTLSRSRGFSPFLLLPHLSALFCIAKIISHSKSHPLRSFLLPVIAGLQLRIACQLYQGILANSSGTYCRKVPGGPTRPCVGCSKVASGRGWRF